MTIRTLPNLPDKPIGIIFWWSNILRGYQLRVYLNCGPLEPEVHLTRAEIEKAAEALAKQHNLHIFEISIPQVTDALLH